MTNKDKHTILMFNGEIYDFDQNNFESDTLFLFEKNKSSNFKNLEGQFSIFYYNKLTANIKIYRDHFGQKPMYYFDSDYFFIASSTIKPISYLFQKLYKKKISLYC